MVDTTDKTVLDLPKVYFVRMMVFTLISAAIVPHLFHSGLWLAVGQCVFVVTGMIVWWWAVNKVPAQS